MVLLGVTMSSLILGDGIVLWEMLEQKCQRRVCQRTDVVQTGQVGWMVLILQWKMVKFPGMFAVAIVLQVADLNLKFLLKIVDPTLSTNCLNQQFVVCATVGPIKGGAKKLTKKNRN